MVKDTTPNQHRATRRPPMASPQSTNPTMVNANPSMVRKTMVAGDFAAEFCFDPQAAPPVYQFTIRHRESGSVLLAGEESSVPDVLRTALESMELFNAKREAKRRTRMAS